MNITQTEKDSVLIGSGYLYALEAEDFTDDTDIDEMVEIGYIKENASFKRTSDATEINSANYGLVDMIGGKYATEFETGIISYNASNVARFLTGSDVDKTVANKTRTYFGENDKRPKVALVFVGTDEETGNEIRLKMPRCIWIGEYNLDFNNDDPVELNYHFRCLNVKMPNGKIGAAWLDEEQTTEAE